MLDGEHVVGESEHGGGDRVGGRGVGGQGGGEPGAQHRRVRDHQGGHARHQRRVLRLVRDLDTAGQRVVEDLDGAVVEVGGGGEGEDAAGEGVLPRPERVAARAPQPEPRAVEPDLPHDAPRGACAGLRSKASSRWTNPPRSVARWRTSWNRGVPSASVASRSPAGSWWRTPGSRWSGKRPGSLRGRGEQQHVRPPRG
ncbi:hypothetical protein ACFQV2_20740 [Actinokineospora soli]|uniref:Uncharacterized protein n=1 Tax=Actinokineospora soli TaxID=1048753 RepID=A0ABW2TS09_9PSEU